MWKIMDNTLYTPGEWFVQWSNSTHCEIRSKSDLSKPIASLNAYYYNKMVFSFEELEHNAKIMAEAKNLLYFTEAFRDHMKGTPLQKTIAFQQIEKLLNRINNE